MVVDTAIPPTKIFLHKKLKAVRQSEIRISEPNVLAQIRGGPVFLGVAFLRVKEHSLLDVSNAGVASFYGFLCHVFACDLSRTCSGSLALQMMRLHSG